MNASTHDLPPCTVSGAVETAAAAPIILRRRRPVNSIGAPRLSPVPPGGRWGPPRTVRKSLVPSNKTTNKTTLSKDHHGMEIPKYINNISFPAPAYFNSRHSPISIYHV